MWLIAQIGSLFLHWLNRRFEDFAKTILRILMVYDVYAWGYDQIDQYVHLVKI